MKYSLVPLCLSMVIVVSAVGTAAADPADVSDTSFTIRADWFDRGNVRVSVPGDAYADKFACIWNAGILPNEAEYDLEFPVTADYTLVALYTANDSRPIDIYLDGTPVHQGFAGVTGSWQTSQARWETQCTVHITEGRHTIKLSCPGPCICHVCALRFESSVPLPAGWKLARPVAARQQSGRRSAPVPPHRVPAIPGIGIQDVRVEQVHVAAPPEDPAVGPLANNELVDQKEQESDVPLRRVRVTVRTPDNRAQEVTLDLSWGNVKRIIAQTRMVLADFRTIARSDLSWITLSENQLQQLEQEVELLRTAPDAEERWNPWAALHIRAAQLEHRVMLQNPLLDFDRLLLVKRRLAPTGHGYADDPYGLPCNWQSNSSIRGDVWDNEIALLNLRDAFGTMTTLYRPDGHQFVGDVDLDFSAERLLFSTLNAHGHWQVCEIQADGSRLRQLTPDLEGVHNYDACYLPDGGIIFSSTASIAAVPCVNGSSLVANLYRLDVDAEGQQIRQLCFDQEHNWCPTVMADGRVLYLRWEYADTPHSHDRILFQMKPDGTGQTEFYGANSYWPNSLFYARPIPNHPTQFVGIVSGHHGVRRMGELVLFDAARGHHEASGVIQRIPGHEQPVEPLIEDQLVDNSWPKFLHPYPLSEKYFLVAAQPTATSGWGIYLADVFDNLVLLAEDADYALFEPLPFRPTPRPPVLPDQVDLQRQDAVVYLSDVYAGEAMAGIPRDTVKQLRIVSYHYLYPNMGGPQGVVGMEGPWDIKRILGTVPVEEDGSAIFRVPASTPISVQPLDADGKAVQLMRSWFTGMPGEYVSCAGCHENRNTSPATQPTLASQRAPHLITPWHGPARGFNFEREVQPVLDKFCVGCHDGRVDEQGQTVVDLRGLERITDYTSAYHFGGVDAGHFSTSYVALHRFVRRPGLESDYHVLMPMEFHADTTDLVRMLTYGHHGVQLDAEAWDRLITWIDLNAPFHGTWTEIAGPERVAPYAQRRRELRRRFNQLEDDPEAISIRDPWPIEPILPPPAPRVHGPAPSVEGWPFDAAEARRRQQALGLYERTVQLPGGIPLDLVRVPAGEFVMGNPAGAAGEQPLHRVVIERPFWIGRFEITNRQYAAFDPSHDSRVESRFGMQFGVRGFYVNGPDQPVVRVSWERAHAFCQWLARETDLPIDLPSEAQWEYACRAGTPSPFFYGEERTDFSPFANLADAMLSEFVCHPYLKERAPLADRSKYDDWIPKDNRWNDQGFLSEAVGRYRPNAWGLCDMHGNVAEWTRSAAWPYPYQEHDGRNDVTLANEQRSVRGGSWRDLPAQAMSGARRGYRSYQGVFNVGFRVVCEAD
ncbi:MAG: SUMF1/EgtB/PvdO family nonheme iron enzyme [Pirellulaceae bacterium]